MALSEKKNNRNFPEKGQRNILTAHYVILQKTQQF